MTISIDNIILQLQQDNEYALNNSMNNIIQEL